MAHITVVDSSTVTPVAGDRGALAFISVGSRFTIIRMDTGEMQSFTCKGRTEYQVFALEKSLHHFLAGISKTSPVEVDISAE